MVNKMSEFEDANVDKDILSQIFGDDLADDTKAEKADDSLFADSAAEEEPAEEPAASEESAAEEPAEQEELSVEDILKAAREEEEPEPVEEELSVEPRRRLL